MAGDPPLVGALSPSTPRVRPISPRALVAEIAAAATALVPQATEREVAVRVGVDAADPGDSGPLADSVVAGLAAAGRAVARVRGADYLNRRSVRLEHGPTDVDAAYERWLDWGGLLREVLDPLADPAVMRWLPRLWDAAADRPAREVPQVAPVGLIAVVDGPYLLRWESSGGFDLVVHLAVSAPALLRRFPGADPRPGAWARYLDECDPAPRADLVVRYDHPQRPAVVPAGRG